MLHGDPSWLSIDLRVFPVRQGQSMFGVPGPTGPADAPRFIQQLMGAARRNSTACRAPRTVQAVSSTQRREQRPRLQLRPRQGPLYRPDRRRERARLLPPVPGSNDHLVLRLPARRPVPTQPRQPSRPAHPASRHHRQRIRHHPCFAGPRIDSTANRMGQQTDKPNMQTFTANADGSEVDKIFGCWLDMNQPFKPDGVTANNVIPATVELRQQRWPLQRPGQPAATDTKRHSQEPTPVPHRRSRLRPHARSPR